MISHSAPGPEPIKDHSTLPLTGTLKLCPFCGASPLPTRITDPGEGDAGHRGSCAHRGVPRRGGSKGKQTAEKLASGHLKTPIIHDLHYLKNVKVREWPCVKEEDLGWGENSIQGVIYICPNSVVSASILNSLLVPSLTPRLRMTITVITTLKVKAASIKYCNGPWAWRSADCLTNVVSHKSRNKAWHKDYDWPHFADEETKGQSSSGHTLESGRAWTPSQVCLTAV